MTRKSYSELFTKELCDLAQSCKASRSSWSMELLEVFNFCRFEKLAFYTTTSLIHRYRFSSLMKRYRNKETKKAPQYFEIFCYVESGDAFVLVTTKRQNLFPTETLDSSIPLPILRHEVYMARRNTISLFNIFNVLYI